MMRQYYNLQFGLASTFKLALKSRVIEVHLMGLESRRDRPVLVLALHVFRRMNNSVVCVKVTSVLVF